MIRGPIHLLGRDINTDLISSAKYFSGGGTREERLKYTLYDYDPEFGVNYKKGTILVADSNFGCGSSREIGASVFKMLGVPAIIAVSFARTFYRNSINIGLPIFEVPDVTSMFSNGDIAVIDSDSGIIKNETTGREVAVPPLPQAIQELIDAGGLLPYIKKQNTTA